MIENNLKNAYIIKTFLILLILFVFSCKQSVTSFNSMASDHYAVLNLSGEEAFRTSFYAFAQERGCINCHSSNQSPHFAANNLSEAYANASGFQNGSNNVKLIDFENPAASIIIEFAGNNHCSDTPCADPEIRDTVQKALETWSAVENAIRGRTFRTNPAPKYLTASMQVPTAIATIFAAKPSLLRFALSELKPKVMGLENAILEFEIQMANASEYRLSKPKIAGNTRAVTISDIKVYIKPTNDPNTIGTEDTYLSLNWHGVFATAAIFALPAPVTLTPFAAVPLTNLPIYLRTETKLDYFTIGFGDIN